MVTQIEIKENGKRRDYRIVICAICALTVLEVTALLKGVNGTLFGIIVAAIAGIAGLMVPFEKVRKFMGDVKNGFKE